MKEKTFTGHLMSKGGFQNIVTEKINSKRGRVTQREDYGQLVLWKFTRRTNGIPKHQDL